MKTYLKLAVFLVSACVSTSAFAQHVIVDGTFKDYRCDVTVQANQQVVKVANISAHGIADHEGKIMRAYVTSAPNGKTYTYAEPGPEEGTSMLSACLSLEISSSPILNKSEAKQLLVSLGSEQYLDLCWWVGKGMFDNQSDDGADGFFLLKLFKRRIDTNNKLSLSMGDQIPLGADFLKVTGPASVADQIAGFPVQISCHYAN